MLYQYFDDYILYFEGFYSNVKNGEELSNFNKLYLFILQNQFLIADYHDIDFELI